MEGYTKDKSVSRNYITQRWSSEMNYIEVIEGRSTRERFYSCGDNIFIGVENI